MTVLSDKLRAGLVALLAFALLLGPCFSMTNMVLAGSALARETVSDGDATSASAHDHHGHAHGLVSHHTERDGNKSPSCDEMCDGWGLQKSKRDLSAAIADRAHDGDDDIDLGAAPLHVNRIEPFSLRKDAARPVSQTGWLAGVAGYTVTSRYRL